jgi:anti-sigma factor RsiW
VRTSRWTQACPRWREDLAAYLVGALDPQARAAVRRHLATCPACQAEHEDLAPVVSWLARLTRPAPACGDTLESPAVATPGGKLPGQASERPAATPPRDRSRSLRCTRIHTFQAAAIFYPNFYPNGRRSEAGMLYILVTATNRSGLPNCVTSLSSWS